MTTIKNINPLRIKDVDFEKLNFSEKKDTKNAKGTDNVFLSYGDDKSWLYVQFPSLRHPFDPNTNDDGSMTITLSFDKSNPKHQVAIEKLRLFDEKVFETLKANRDAWLPKKTINNDWKIKNYTSFLKIKEVEDDDGNKEERFFNIKLKLPAKERQLITKIYDSNMNEMSSSFITPRCTIEPIARPARLWFQKTGKVGITWECALMRIKKQDQNVSVEQIFGNDSDDDQQNPNEESNNEHTPVSEEESTDALQQSTGALDITSDNDNKEDLAADEEQNEGNENEDEPEGTEETEEVPVVASKPRGRKGKVIAK